MITRLVTIIATSLALYSFGVTSQYSSAAELVRTVKVAVAARKLPEREISKFQSEALNGNGQSAYALSNHYSLQEDTEESNYWYRLAIENGDQEALQKYSGELWMSGGFRNCTRAAYLMGKVASNLRGSESDASKEILKQNALMKSTLATCIAQRCVTYAVGSRCDRQADAAASDAGRAMLRGRAQSTPRADS